MQDYRCQYLQFQGKRSCKNACLQGHISFCGSGAESARQHTIKPRARRYGLIIETYDRKQDT